MNSDTRLAEIIATLEAAGVSCLIMGGHAVRFYGLLRYTSDFDLHVSAEGWRDLPARLNGTPLAVGGPLHEGPSWRPHAFRRFQIGQLPDGKEEWLEFWCGNHLLDPFPTLYTRRQEGEYGGRRLAFLGLSDLIRSKETERESDWEDILVLEEFLDAHSLSDFNANRAGLPAVLSKVRSRRGFDRLRQTGLFADLSAVRTALAAATHPVSWCY